MSRRGRASRSPVRGGDELTASSKTTAASVAEICAQNPDLARLFLQFADTFAAGAQAAKPASGAAARVAPAGCATLSGLQGPTGPSAISESGIAAGKDSSPSPEEEPMYSWVSNKPYGHHKKWRVWFRGLDGKRCHETFDTEEAALGFVEKGKRRLLPHGGHPVGDLLEEHLAGRKGKIRDSSIQTLKFRIEAMIPDLLT
jgi:hypothetical protein